MRKTPGNLEIEGNVLNLIRKKYKEPRANMILNGEKLNAFPLRLGQRQGCPFSLVPIQQCTGIS